MECNFVFRCLVNFILRLSTPAFRTSMSFLVVRLLVDINSLAISVFLLLRFLASYFLKIPPTIIYNGILCTLTFKLLDRFCHSVSWLPISLPFCRSFTILSVDKHPRSLLPTWNPAYCTSCICLSRWQFSFGRCWKWNPILSQKVVSCYILFDHSVFIVYAMYNRNKSKFWMYIYLLLLIQRFWAITKIMILDWKMFELNLQAISLHNLFWKLWFYISWAWSNHLLDKTKKLTSAACANLSLVVDLR